MGRCGGEGRGLEEKGFAAKNKCWISCRFYFPKSERLQEGWLGEGAREGRGDEPSLGGLHSRFELFPQSGNTCLPEERWHTLRYVQFSDYDSVGCTSLSPPFHVRELAFPIIRPLIFSQRYNDTFEFDHWWLSVMVLIPHSRMFSLFNESYSIFLQCFSYHGNGIFFS